MSLKTAYQRVGNEINAKLVDEFALQGHHMTGAFEESLELLPDDTGVTTMGNTYGIYLNIGVKAEQIKYPYAKARINGLARFVQFRKGIGGKEGLSIAFAIATVQAKEGMPTKGSYQYSSTGKRTDYIDEAIEKVDIEQIIFDEFVSVIDTQKNITGR